ncbi:MAG: SDR family oxidoreductase, partial [Chitinophagaceae bacterium]|nr:SDR family oxidoreductase [Chitinophagaceae bacterium]MCU0383126.1 SDR family oxidoreductase [Cyclobacteriaceae bacterium]
MFSLQGKNIVVTGASSGIGRATAILCANQGGRIIAMGRDLHRLNETIKLLSGNQSHFVFPGDFTVEDTLIGFEQFLKDNHIKVSGVVHAAGVSPTVTLRALSSEKVKSTFSSNVESAFMLSKVCCKSGIVHPDGASIVWIASVTASVGAVGKALYGASKSALVAAAKGLALEYASKKIRFNTLSPGVVITPMSMSSVYSKNEEALKHV